MAAQAVRPRRVVACPAGVTVEDVDAKALRLRVAGVEVVVEGERRALELLGRVYGAMSGGDVPASLHYRVSATAAGRQLRRGGWCCDVPTDAALLWEFDRDLIIEIQRQRSTLLFVHAAVVERHGLAALIVAPSGTGKSTLTWTMVHQGAGYVSDELAPIDLVHMRVEPFTRAVNLKHAPPPDYPLPDSTIYTDEALHIPVAALPTRIATEALPVAAVVFLQRPQIAQPPALTRLSISEGAQRLYVNTLNALAHESAGLQSAVRVATASACFELIAGEPMATARVALRMLDDLAAAGRASGGH